MRVLAVSLVLIILASGCYGLESRKRAAQLEYEKGMRLYHRIELEGAKKAFEHALWLNPNHDGAKAYLRRVKMMLAEPLEPED